MGKRMPENCPLKEKSLMREDEHALAEVDMLFAHQEKLYCKGRSSSIHSYVKSMNAVVVALPLSGDTAHKPPKGG